MGVVVGPLRSGGMEAVVWLPAKQQVRGLQPPWCLFHADKLWLDLEKRSNPRACDRVGVVHAILVLSGGATLLHSSGVIPCACSELWWNYLA